MESGDTKLLGWFDSNIRFYSYFKQKYTNNSHIIICIIQSSFIFCKQ
nr:MAG TPA_asm: hypothetical protein [Bacteriophage sp.]